MATHEVSIRDLRNRGGDVVDRVERGSSVVITRSGRAVAELKPLGRTPLTASALIERRRSLPVVDPEALRSDVDALMDPSV